MADDPLNDLTDTIYGTAAEAVPLVIAPKKWTALKTALAYMKTMSAWIGAAILSLGTVNSGGSIPSISQTSASPVARPEEHLPGINRDDDTVLEAENMIEAELVSVVQVSAYDTIRVSDEETVSIDKLQ